MRVRLTILISTVLLVCPSSGVMSSVWLPADKYLALRRQVRAITGQPAMYVLSDANLVQNGAIEVKGTVCGVARRGDSSTFIINTPNQSVVVRSSDPDPQIQSGNCVRMLVKAASGNSELEALGAAWDYEITQREKKEIERARKLQKAIASRGSTRRDPLAGKWRDVIEPYKRAITGFNRKLTARQAETIAICILEYSERYNLDPRLVVAVVLAESHFRIDATSRKGAMGLGQLMPGTAAGLGVTNAYDPQQNLAGAVRLIRGHLDRLSGGAKWSQLTWDHLALALASYNAGPGAVRRYGGVPPYRETQTYIARVISVYKQLCGCK